MRNTTRLKNLHLLACECSTQANLAQRIGIAHSEIIRYFRNKHTDISDAFARTIESKLDKPEGWMDRPNFELALTADEWQLLRAYRAGTDRDKGYLQALAQQALSYADSSK